MEKLSITGYKIVKMIHILSASIWIGTAITVFYMLKVVLNKDNVLPILKAVQNIDFFIIIPSNLITFITGLIFSIGTDWGFFKHRWIIIKYIINLLPIIGGALIFGHPIFSMIAIAEEKGVDALTSTEFIISNKFMTIAFIVMIVLLFLAVYLSIYKPKIRKVIKKS
jgi:uncharacterized membrane protein